MMNNTDKLSSIAIKVDQVQRNIAELEQILTSTTSPADSTIAELKMLKDVRSFYLTQYSNAMEEDDDSSRDS